MMLKLASSLKKEVCSFVFINETSLKIKTKTMCKRELVIAILFHFCKYISHVLVMIACFVYVARQLEFIRKS